MAPRNSSILVTARLRSFFERIGENPEDNEYEFLDEENATVHEINVIYRVVNTLRDGQWDHDVITSMLDGLTRAKARAAARAAATRRARTRRSSRSRSNSRSRSRSNSRSRSRSRSRSNSRSRSRSRPRTPVSTQGGKRRTRKH